MQNATERRQLILEALSDRRQVARESLAIEFGVSERTIQRDIDILTCFAPINTIMGPGGGFRVADGYYVGRRYLHKDQEALLRELMDGLQPDKQQTIQSILTAFAMPKQMETKSK
jgi:predicted DNA-binding transcriptional regulator YafY